MSTRWDRRSPTEQQRDRARLLASWLPDATSYAPHWAEVVGAAGMAPGGPATAGDLARVPPSVQHDVEERAGLGLVQRPTAAQLEDAVQPPLLHRLGLGAGQDMPDRRRELLLEEFKPIHVIRGGVGDALAVASSRADVDRAMRAGVRTAALLGLTDHDYVVSSVPAGPTADYWRLQAMTMGTHMLALHPRGHLDGFERCVEAFALVPATVAACLPEEAVAWAELLASADADVSRVVCVLLLGPPVDDDRRQEIEDAWRAAGALERELVVRHAWAPDVHRATWVECRDGVSGLHTVPDLELLEVLDPVTGLDADGAGDLTVTTLGWRGTTLLRYRTGVRVEGIDTSPCPACGRTVPRIVGEVQDAAWHRRLARADGDVWVDARAVEAAASGLVGVRAWRVRLVRGRDGGDGYVVEAAGADGVEQRLAKRLAAVTGTRADAAERVDDVGRLERAVAVGGRIVDDR